MRSKLYSLILVLVILSCNNKESDTPFISDEQVTDTPTTPDESSSDINEILSEGFQTTQISVSIEFPEDFSQQESLNIATLASRKSLNDNTSLEIDIFESDDYEILFVENQSGEPIIYGLTIPSNTDQIVLNAQSTAISLIMMHTWAMNFSTSAKNEIIQLIEDDPDFTNFVALVAEGINNHDLSQISVTDYILGFLDGRVESNKAKFEITLNEDPLEITFNNGKVELINHSNINAYGLRLYNEEENTESESFLLDGVQKELISSNRIFNVFKGELGLIAEESQTINIPSDGKWLLRLDTGMTFENTIDDNKARYINVTSFVANVAGLFSGSLKQAMLRNECITSLGVFMGSQMKNLIDDFVLNGSRSQLLDNTLDLFASLSDGAIDIIKGCSDKSIEKGLFKTVLRKLAQIDKAESLTQLAFYGIDWIQYPSKLEYCFEQNNGEVFYCSGLELSGDLNFGELEVGLTSQKSLSISNSLKESIEVLNITLPNGFSANWTTGTLEPESSRNILITFQPESAVEYLGELEIATDGVSEKLTQPLSGKGKEPEVSQFDLFEYLTSFDSRSLSRSNCSHTRVFTQKLRPDLNTVTTGQDCPPGYAFRFNPDGSLEVTNSPITSAEFAGPGSFGISGNSVSMSFGGGWSESEGNVQQERSFSFSGTYNEETGQIEGTGTFFGLTVINTPSSGEVTTIEFTSNFNGKM